VTFRDLQKVIESQPDYSSSELERLGGKAFWHWDRGEHRQKDRSSNGDCCFNHIIGLPRKDGKRKPLFDYEGMLYKALRIPGYFNSYPSVKTKDIPSDNVMYPFKEKHLWILKATGLGVTECMLRFMAWLCLKDDDCRDSQMVIVTGPNQELAKERDSSSQATTRDRLTVKCHR
jgi:hypothetical protein